MNIHVLKIKKHLTLFMNQLLRKIPVSKKLFYLKNFHYSPLYNLQKNLNPTLTSFGNYQLPLKFPDYITQEVVTKTRQPNFCTVFDVSQMNRLELYLPNYQKSPIPIDNPDNILPNYLEKIFPINTQVLKENKSLLSVVLDDRCHIQDDFIISNIDNQKYRFIVNANTTDTFIDTVKEYLPEGATLKKIETIILAIQGPHSQIFLENLLDVDLKDLYFMENRTIPYLDSELEISRCGYTGEDGFELYLNPNLGKNIYEKILLEAEINRNILLGGLLERDILRLEAGLCLSGNEFGEKLDIHFQESNLDFIIGKRRRQDLNFRGAQNFNLTQTQTPKLKRCGFTCHRPIRPSKIYYQGLEVGFITSGVKSYNLDKFIAMGYLNADLSKQDNNESLYLQVRGKEVEIKTHELPFVKTNYYRRKSFI